MSELNYLKDAGMHYIILTSVDRFVEQIKSVQPFVDNIVTFAYSHYYSPNITNSGFHESYLYYIKNGFLKNNTPDPPSNLNKYRLSNGNILLTWNAPEDISDVCGYLVYRNGTQLKCIEVQRIDASGSSKVPETIFTDNTMGRDVAGFYEVKTFDFSGNISKKSAGVY